MKMIEERMKQWSGAIAYEFHRLQMSVLRQYEIQRLGSDRWYLKSSTSRKADRLHYSN